jgi:hypothetical protein
MSNSPLVEYTHISPFRNHPRNQPITKVTWHHTAGVCSLEQFDAIVHRPGRNMSANYCVDKDARVGLFCPEEDRCWCSSSAWNDNRAVVLEISNSRMGEPWPISDKVYKKCIELTVDICKRNGIKKLTFTGDKNGSLTFHRFFAATGCLPIHTTEVLTRKGWKLLKDVMIGDEIATVSPNDMYLTFSHVQNLVPVKKDTVYTRNGMTVTGDHRVLTVVNGADNKFVQFNELEESKDDYVVPAAAIASRNGIDMTSSEFVFLLEMQKIGKINDNNELEFTYIVESKKEFFQGLLTNIGFEYTKTQEDLGPVRFTITDKRAIELVNEYLVDGKEFNWRWLDLSPTQFSYFIYKITHHVNGNWNRQYTSDSMTNIDIVQAICAINQRGTYYDRDKDILYVTKPYRIINEDTPVEKTEDDVEVSCVTVASGAFLIRQHGVVTITGNCPGPYIFSKAQEICDLVNAQLNGDTPTPTPTPDPDPEPVVSDIKAGDLVSIKAGATWYQSDNKVPAWVIKQNWYVDSIIAQRAVLGKNEKGDSNIQSPIHVKNLTVVDKKEEPKEEKPKDEYPKKTLYTKHLAVGTIIHTVANRKLTGTNGKITVAGFYTIIQEDMIDGVKYGQLKSGAGWVNLDKEDIEPTPTKEIKVGDYVKVVKGETYDGKKLVIYEKKYKVLQIKGDRVVISADGKHVTAAVRLNNCIKV